MILLRWIWSYYLIIFKYLNSLFSWFFSFYNVIKKKCNCTCSIKKVPLIIGFSETWSLVKLGTTECFTHFQGTVLVILLILTFHNLRPFVHYLLSIICLPLLIFFFFYLFFNLMCRMTVEIQGRGAFFFWKPCILSMSHSICVSKVKLMQLST